MLASHRDRRASQAVQGIFRAPSGQRKAVLFQCQELLATIPREIPAAKTWIKKNNLVRKGASRRRVSVATFAVTNGLSWLSEELLRTRLDFSAKELLGLTRQFVATERDIQSGRTTYIIFSPAGVFANSLRAYVPLLNAHSQLRKELVKYTLCVHDKKAARRIMSLLGNKESTEESPQPSILDEMLLNSEGERSETRDDAWRAFLAALQVPQPNDHATPVQFVSRDAFPTLKLKALNTLLSEAPELTYNPDAAKAYFLQLFPRPTEADALLLLNAAIALSHVNIPWVFENERSQRFHRGYCAVIMLARMCFELITEPSEEYIRDVCSGFCGWKEDAFQPSWSYRAIDLLCFYSGKQAEKLPTATRWALLRFREHLCLSAMSVLSDRLPEIDRKLGIGVDVPVSLSEPWTLDLARSFRTMTATRRAAWTTILKEAAQSRGSTPTSRILRSTTASLQTIGQSSAITLLLSWIELFATSRPVLPGGPIEGGDGSIPLATSAASFRGIVWLASLVNSREVIRKLGELVHRCYGKVPGRGPRCILIGNAAIWALGQIPGPDALGQLAMLRVKVKFIPAQKAIEKALNAAAARAGLPREEIEELGVPTYGLSEVGVRREELGETIVELSAHDGDVPLRYFKKDAGGNKGKEVKSVPASVKKDFASELKELKAAAKDVGSMLSAQRDRIDSMFLDDRSWPIAAWRERYLDHPVVGVVARRLIWNVTDGSRRTGVMLGPEGLVGFDGKACDFSERAIVRLWHPVEAPTEETLAWRRFVEDRKIRQPFKQAHREVYLLTDAERRTETYSNRFAAHIVRQHQFKALCDQRNWRHKLRLMVDAEYPPPSRIIRAHGLRAEFWVEPVGDDFGTDTNESGAYLHLATDQVRFYRMEAAPNSVHAGGGAYAMAAAEGNAINMPLRVDSIPALVLSEVLRDCDLFVGVTSVGNNPQWNDGGPNQQFRDYWQNYSFGELSATAETRRDLLSRLVPRLKIADRCALTDKFLTVRGSLRTYKIHLGSGNILMEPNDEYLCIVPTSRNELGSNDVFLPFEGDRTLSIILSKAFMLADDARISDLTITRQIRRE